MHERLLIIEDEDTLCESLKRVFTREGYIVETSSSAEDAMQLITQKDFDLVITDIMLPGIDGLCFMKSCRLKRPDLLFIIMTAYAHIWTADDAKEAGAINYIIKPISHEVIKKAVRDALDSRRNF